MQANRIELIELFEKNVPIFEGYLLSVDTLCESIHEVDGKTNYVLIEQYEKENKLFLAYDKLPFFQKWFVAKVQKPDFKYFWHWFDTNGLTSLGCDLEDIKIELEKWVLFLKSSCDESVEITKEIKRMLIVCKTDKYKQMVDDVLQEYTFCLQDLTTKYLELTKKEKE